MPAYTYEALDAQGTSVQGVIEADSARAARNALRTQALLPLAVQQVAAGQPSSPDGAASALPRWLRPRVLSHTALAVLTRQLAGLVSSGLPLERALSALAEEADTPAQRQLLAALRAEVNAGSTFARALAQHPREFSDIYCAVIGAGEQSGQLGVVLERLADELEHSQALRSRLLGAALYPAIVTLVALAIVVFLMTYVVPQVASVLVGTKRALPMLTQIMLTLSDVLRQWGWALALVSAAGLAALTTALKNDSLRERWDAAWLRLPLIGRLSRSYNTTRFASTLAMLAAAGVPILRALQTAALTLPNRALRADALEALVLVREGAPLAAALAQKKRFPPLLTLFARLGEQTGTLPAMLARAATQLSEQVQRRALQLATILEPLLIVGMGLVVLLIVLAVLLPIIELNTYVK